MRARLAMSGKEPAAVAPGYGGPELAAWLERLERMHPRKIDLGLERVGAVASRMGLRFDCTVIVVAGTNGKGSTCAMLESILLAAGYRVGLYSSPHLDRKSTRLNSSHVKISYAVFCLKKKKSFAAHE